MRFVSCGVLAVLGTSVFADVESGLAALDEGRVQDAAAAFQAAFEAGDADGAFYLGRLVELGVGIEANVLQAAQVYQQAAEAGSAQAQNRLGLMYIQGAPVLKDFERGTELVCQAAEAGDANGQFNCGVSFAEGIGVDTDAERARTLWEQAAAQDHIAAMNFLGLSLRDEADLAGALGWFERTASLGNPMGLYEAARILATSAAPDLVQAYAYANLAAARLHPDAGAFRDQLEQRMSAAEIVEAQAVARSWEPAAEAAAATVDE